MLMYYLRFAAVLFILTLTLGCGPRGPELGTVSGVVTLDGKPIPEAEIIFQPIEKGDSPSIGVTDADGRYELLFTIDAKGAVVGKHKVMITTFQSNTDVDGNETLTPELFPPKYNAETELERDVQAGDNVIDFDLTT